MTAMGRCSLTRSVGIGNDTLPRRLRLQRLPWLPAYWSEPGAPVVHVHQPAAGLSNVQTCDERTGVMTTNAHSLCDPRRTSGAAGPCETPDSRRRLIRECIRVPRSARIIAGTCERRGAITCPDHQKVLVEQPIRHVCVGGGMLGVQCRGPRCVGRVPASSEGEGIRIRRTECKRNTTECWICLLYTSPSPRD